MSDIQVGSVVFHKSGAIQGPGTVTKIVHDEDMGIDMFHVMWQSSHTEHEHTRRSLLTLAQMAGIEKPDA